MIRPTKNVNLAQDSAQCVLWELVDALLVHRHSLTNDWTLLLLTTLVPASQAFLMTDTRQNVNRAIPAVFSAQALLSIAQRVQVVL